MRKIKALLLMAVPVLLLSCNSGTNRGTNDTDDDARENREYRENMDNDRDRDNMENRDHMENRGTNQGADRDTINQDL